MRWLLVSLLSAPLAVGASPAFAQANPSADQIIRQLTPNASMLTGAQTRGIHPLQTTDQPVRASQMPAGSTAEAVNTARPRDLVVTHAPAQAAAPSVNLTVNFATGSAELTDQARATLDVLGQALSSNALAQYRFRVEGHTDTVGSPAVNQALSSRRAEAVVAYIAAKYNVATDRMHPVGLGSDDPLVPTADQTPEPRNRRVQVVNIGS